MDKNCRLQLFEMGPPGPVKFDAKLRLVDEFGKASTFGVSHWLFFDKRLIARAGWLGRLSASTLFLDAGLRVASHWLSRGMHVGLPSALLIPLCIEAGLAGPSRFIRSPARLEGRVPVREIALTREQYSAFVRDLKGKRGFYSPFFNNCVHQCRREFRAMAKLAEAENAGRVVQPFVGPAHNPFTL